MKKIFFFAATMMAAMTINATVYDLTTLTAESDWTVENATKNTKETTDAKLVYDLKAEVEATVTPSTLSSDITFVIKNSSDKAKGIVIPLGKGFEFGGKNGILKIENVKSGATIKLVVAAKGSTVANFADETNTYPKGAVAVTEDLTCPAKSKGAEGADDEGYIWKTLEYTANNEGIVEIKEFAGGYRIQSIEIIGATANENVTAEVKAVKSIENGQLVILKNGVKYNALGTVIE